jgi:hypothetical protein
MDSLTDERNTWFNAVRLEDSHDYSSAALAYIEDANRCLGRSLFIRSAMSAACAASCLATIGDVGDAVELYSVSASLYEHNADVNIGKSMREALWSLLHAFEYFTLASDLVSAERASKKYADLARRVDRFETRSAFETLKSRRETVLVARSSLGTSQMGISVKNFADSRIQLSMKSFLRQVQAIAQSSLSSEFLEEEKPEEKDHLLYESESDFNERSIVS